MAVSCTYNFGMTVNETLETGVVGSSNPLVKFEAYNESGTLNATSTVPATKHAQFLLTLSGGAATINLAALTGANGTVDGTGLKVQMIRVKNLGANTMTFSEGASNGYALWTSFSKPVYTGGIWQEFFNDTSPDIASGDRTIDVAGTGSQTAEVSILMG